jgi:hypothetical protein
MGDSLLDWDRRHKSTDSRKNSFRIESQKADRSLKEDKKGGNLFDFLSPSEESNYPALFNDEFDEGDFKVAVLQWKMKNGLLFSSQ